jgi:hypothetical protein
LRLVLLSYCSSSSHLLFLTLPCMHISHGDLIKSVKMMHTIACYDEMSIYILHSALKYLASNVYPEILKEGFSVGLLIHLYIIFPVKVFDRPRWRHFFVSWNWQILKKP